MSKESQDKKFKEAEQFIDNFVEFISDADGLTDEEMDVILQQKGIAISELIKNVQNQVNNALEKDRLSWQEEAKASRILNLQKLRGVRDLLTLGKNELIDRLKAIVQTEETDFLLAHRNLKPEDLSEEELREILSEYEQLEGGE